ncbi:MAG: hypothetical protein WCY89_01760 [Flavobacteriaceae bacterium]
MSLYHKNQLFYLVVAILFFGYALFFYLQNDPTTTYVGEYLIVNKRCSAAPRISSYVEIEKEGKAYTINLSEQKCRNYAIGQKIILNYNEKYDYFFHADSQRNKVDNFRLIVSSIAVFLLLLPWKYLLRTFDL